VKRKFVNASKERERERENQKLVSTMMMMMMMREMGEKGYYRNREKPNEL